MKMKPEHFAHMKAEITKLDRSRITDHKAALAYDPRVKDLDKRFRWDLSHAARLTPWICDNLYSYLDDSHVDTALRSIVRELDL